jgi:hypothetical protein
VDVVYVNCTVGLLNQRDLDMTTYVSVTCRFATLDDCSSKQFDPSFGTWHLSF